MTLSGIRRESTLDFWVGVDRPTDREEEDTSVWSRDGRQPGGDSTAAAGNSKTLSGAMGLMKCVLPSANSPELTG